MLSPAEALSVTAALREDGRQQVQGTSEMQGALRSEVARGLCHLQGRPSGTCRRLQAGNAARPGRRCRLQPYTLRVHHNQAGRN